MTVCEIDLRVDGAWRYVIQMPGIQMLGSEEYGFHGVFREIAPHEKLVRTSIFEQMPQYPSLVTVVLEERDGKTFMTQTTRHETTEARDGHLHSGVENGSRQSLDRLEEYVASLTLVA